MVDTEKERMIEIKRERMKGTERENGENNMDR